MAEESIYNLIPQPVAVPAKQASYHSKHSGSKPPSYSTFGLTGTSKPGVNNVAGADAPIHAGHHEYNKTFATMGRDDAGADNSLLKKSTGIGGGAGDAANATAKGFAYSADRRPPVPTKDELSKMKKSNDETKDFIKTNAINTIMSKPKQPEPAKDWLKKPHYGEVPPYLDKIKKEVNDEYEYIRSMQQQHDDVPAGMRLLPEEERLSLINDLKAKWDSVNATYQQSSVLSLASLDTIGKVKRKEMYEAQLAQIEKDIEKLSKKFVYVQDDQ